MCKTVSVFLLKSRALWQCTFRQLAGCWSWVCSSQVAGRGSLTTDSVTCLQVKVEVAGMQVEVAGAEVEVVGLCIADSRVRLIVWSQQAAVRSELARPRDWRSQQVAVQGLQ
ncbi:UNVERIFIED_CONTAM: hypothetical protein Slati_2680400 [Sesamum latifolium]|uniref:Secreted protein n=1 Tax=Sesamum latifolium TaxID=2727402 RepID=A0AAW2VX38_9LAMI